MESLLRCISKLQIRKNKQNNSNGRVSSFGATPTTTIQPKDAKQKIKVEPTTCFVDSAIPLSLQQSPSPRGAVTARVLSPKINTPPPPPYIKEAKIFTGKRFRDKHTTYTVNILSNPSAPPQIKYVTKNEALNDFSSKNINDDKFIEPLAVSSHQKPQVSAIGSNFFASSSESSKNKPPGFLLSNARSFNIQKIKFFERKLQSVWTSVDVLLIGETWFATRTKNSQVIRSKPPKLREVTGFTGFFTDRDLIAQNKLTGGGVAVYLSKLSCSQPSVVFTERTNIYEILAVLFFFKQCWWLAVSFYIIPGQEHANRDAANTRLFQRILTAARAHQAHFITVIGGDFNKTHANLPGFVNLVRVPTRGQHILDLIYTDADPNLFKPVRTYDLGKNISDHLAVELVAA